MAAAFIVSTAGGSWTASGSWTNSSTSASWSFAAPITFNSAGSQTMTFANVAQEFGRQRHVQLGRVDRYLHHVDEMRFGPGGR